MCTCNIEDKNINGNVLLFLTFAHYFIDSNFALTFHKEDYNEKIQQKITYIQTLLYTNIEPIEDFQLIY